MAVSRSNPVALEVLRARPTPDLRKDVEELAQHVEEAERDMLPWLQKQRKLTELRYGHTKARKLPWRGAANLHIPLIDGIIRRWRPGIASLILDAAPVVAMEPQEAGDLEVARQAEEFLTSLFLDRMATAPQIVRLADLIAHRGLAFAREGWDYKTRYQCRVVEAEALFPGGVEEFVLAQQQAAQQQGQERPSPEQIVSSVLVSHFDLDPQGPEEGPMLQHAVEALLQGAPFVKVVSHETERDLPAWLAVDPVRCVWPVDESPEDAEFFCVLHDMTIDEVLKRARDGVFEKDAAAVAAKRHENSSKAKSSTEDSLREDIEDFLRRRKRTTEQSQRKRIRVWELYAKIDLNGDGLLERCVLWYAPDARAVLALFNYPYPFDTWPITTFVFSGDADHPLDSRGMSEMLATFQKIQNEFHNARLNASQILLAPVFKRRAGGNSTENTIPWRPGGVVTLQDVNDLQPVVHDLRILAELIREEQANQRQAETYIGVFDATLTSLQQSRERRTAAEVNAIQAVSSSIFGLDAKLFQTAFSRSITKVWNLYLEYGQDELFVRMRGQDFPIPVRKADIGKNFDVRASGTPANTNRQFQLSNIQQAMAVIMSPAVAASGRFDIGELVRMWLQLLDSKIADTIIRSGEESAAAQTIMQAAQLGASQLDQEPPSFI